MEQIQEKCGIVGIYSKDFDVSPIIRDGLFVLQHRGQHGSGMAVSDGTEIVCRTGQGLVGSVYTPEVMASLAGRRIGIGHVRYATSKGDGVQHLQPIVVNDDFAIAHNGNMPDTTSMEDFLRSKGWQTEGFADSKLMAQVIYYHIEQGLTVEEAIVASFPLFIGAFSIVAMTKTALFAFRDHCGIRPLVIGRFNGSTVIASETCALDAIGAKFIREVYPGEIVRIDETGLYSNQVMRCNPKLDSFEAVYFSSPASLIYGQVSVASIRERWGAILAREYPVDVDFVVPVLSSGLGAALSYAHALGLPAKPALVTNSRINRTFIESNQSNRISSVRRKFSPVADMLRGKRIALIDDSIVRGTTSKELVKMLFEPRIGVSEVHLVVSSPPVKFPDFYGINTPRRRDLIASHMSGEEIRKYIGVDSLHFLSLEGLKEGLGLPPDMFSYSCFTGEYPIDLGNRVLELD